MPLELLILPGVVIAGVFYFHIYPPLKEAILSKRKTLNIFFTDDPKEHPVTDEIKYDKNFPVFKTVNIDGNVYPYKQFDYAIVKGDNLHAFGLSDKSIIAYYTGLHDSMSYDGKFVILKQDEEISKLDPFGKITFHNKHNIIRKCIGEITIDEDSHDNIAETITKQLFKYIRMFSKTVSSNFLKEDTVRETVRNSLVAHPNTKKFYITVRSKGAYSFREPIIEVFPAENLVGYVVTVIK